jgi:TRAP-type C4-dicarboxylate transport system permease small subunit
MHHGLEWLSRRAMWIAGFCYLLITVLICFDIFARKFLGFSTESTTELTGYLMAVGMSWGLAGTLFERGHVRIDVLVQRMPLRVRVWLHLASLLALLVSTGFYVYGAVSIANDSFAFNATDLTTLRTPLVLPQGLWAAGFVLLLLAALALALRSVGQLMRGDLGAMDRALMARTYEDEAAETLEAVAEAQAHMQAPGYSSTKVVAEQQAPIQTPSVSSTHKQGSQ